MTIKRLPPLTDELLSEIIWGMENQKTVLRLNVNDGTLYDPQDNDGSVNEEDLVELPTWTSSNGYQMMVSFTNACQDQRLKERLTRELEKRAPGVFRRFRDILAENEEDLKSWFDFKDRRMKTYIRSWYRTRYERPSDDKETGDFDLGGELLFDYEVCRISTLDDYCRALLDRVSDNPVTKKILGTFSDMSAFEVLRGSEVCGAIVYEIIEDHACIVTYYIEKENRGKGLFSLMLDLLNRELERRQVKRVVLPVSEQSAFLRKVFSDHSVSLKPLVTGFSFDLQEWICGIESSESAYVI